jgi:hypothetical protein
MGGKTANEEKQEARKGECNTEKWYAETESPERLVGDLCNAPLPRPACLSHQFPSLPTGQERVELYFHWPIRPYGVARQVRTMAE